MSLADKVRGEQTAVTGGAEGCKASHPFEDVDTVCMRVTHLPDDHVHAGMLGEQLIQWEDLT